MHSAQRVLSPRLHLGMNCVLQNHLFEFHAADRENDGDSVGSRTIFPRSSGAVLTKTVSDQSWSGQSPISITLLLLMIVKLAFSG